MTLNNAIKTSFPLNHGTLPLEPTTNIAKLDREINWNITTENSRGSEIKVGGDIFTTMEGTLFTLTVDSGHILDTIYIRTVGGRDPFLSLLCGFVQYWADTMEQIFVRKMNITVQKYLHTVELKKLCSFVEPGHERKSFRSSIERFIPASVYSPTS